jgi:putative nucleotidyltransferase with HDIG domain
MIATRLDIEQLVGAELPPLPSAAMRVAALTQDLDSTSRSISEAIGADPALATRVLRAANSPLYAMERHVTALPAAVCLLGNNAIHLLVVISSAGDAFRRNGRQGPFEHALWEHSVAVGLAARETSRMLGMRGGEEAFLCGLLHDIGKLLLLRHEPEMYRQVLQCGAEEETLELEQELFGYTHAQVGALVARRWGLPDEISYAIFNHHQPGEAGSSVFMARVIDVADYLANAHGLGLRAEPAEGVAASESALALRLTGQQLRLIAERMQADLRLVMDTFK